jgi:RNA polymerase sigma factor (sigma-70 family)
MSQPSSVCEQHPRAPRPGGSARVADLYPQLAPQLRRILATNLTAPDWLYEEACQTAWESLLVHGDQVTPGSELSWLSTTATRSALRALRRERAGARPLSSLDPAAADARAKVAAATPFPSTEQACELHERLASLSHLPDRAQRILLLHGFGYDYREIARATGCSPRTVTRQITRARRRLSLATAPDD